MDIEKLIGLLQNNRHPNGLKARAATALSTLQAENEKLRAEVESLKKGHCAGCSIPAVKAEQIRDLTDAPKLRAELERVKAERDALIDDFVDYVTGGVPNPAIFCKNRCDKCTDMRGWCTGKNCKGFYPSGASGQKED